LRLATGTPVLDDRRFQPALRDLDRNGGSSADPRDVTAPLARADIDDILTLLPRLGFCARR
jgi:hypothetical protein